MDAGDSDVVETSDAGVEELSCDCGLFGDGEVAGSGADYGDVAYGFGVRGLAESDGAGLRVVRGGGYGFEDGERCGLVGAGGEDIVAGGGHAGEDFRGLGGGLSGSVDDLGETGA